MFHLGAKMNQESRAREGPDTVQWGHHNANQVKRTKQTKKKTNKSNNQTNHTKTKTNTNVHAISHDMITMQTIRYPRTFPDVPLAGAIIKAVPYASH